MTRLFEAKPFIIAEVGSNWQGLERCLKSIEVAKECGADAVKFQAFSHDALYGQPFTPVTIDWHPVYSPVRLVKMQCELDLSWLPALKAKADEVGIEFMCTAFSPELVAAVDPYVSVHKVASSDAAWPQLLRAVRDTGKPAIISMGAKTNGEINQIEQFMDDGRKYISTFCVAAYPADYVDLDAAEVFEGFSDHSLGFTAAVEMAHRGAVVIEKHFTAFPDLDTPDRPHSLTPTQFKRMVDIIRGREVESEEKDMYLRHNRRLIATKDITTNVVFNYGENFGAYRSLKDDTRGLSPFDWERVEGKTAVVDIKRGDSIGEGDF